MAATAVSTVFDLFEKNHILENVHMVGAYLEKQLEQLVQECGNVLARRGTGLMQGLVLKDPVAEIIHKAIEKGLLVISAGGNVLRMLPPLIISKENVDEMMGILRDIL